GKGAVSTLQCGSDPATRLVPVAGHLDLRTDGARTKPLLDGGVQQLLQLYPDHGELRHTVPGPQTVQLGVDVDASKANERPLPRTHADAVEHFLTEAHFVKLPSRVGLKVDAYAQRLDLPHGFEYETGDADLVKGQGKAQTADTRTGDQYWITSHRAGL